MEKEAIGDTLEVVKGKALSIDETGEHIEGASLTCTLRVGASGPSPIP
jgi:hypothetical protein